MRVIGGSRKGRRLASFKGRSVRPTSDKVREAVFNILPMDFPFNKALDLFAGTGAMGIEALSRGAEQAVFVESDPASVTIIKKNIEACAFESRARVLRKDAAGSIDFLRKQGESFDLIFIDPPYDTHLLTEAVLKLDKAGILSPGGVIVAEASRRNPLRLEGLANLRLSDERRYGDTVVYFLIPLTD